jgi:hypothetical protein
MVRIEGAMTKSSSMSAAIRRDPRWGPVGLVAAAAVTAGLFLPMLFASGNSATATVAARAESIDKNDLNYVPPTWPESPDAKSMLFRLVLGTALVLGLCVVTLRLGKPWLTGMPGPKRGAGQLFVVETLALGNRCCLHLVNAADRQILVGVDSSGLKSVLPLPELFEQAFKEADTTVPGAVNA